MTDGAFAPPVSAPLGASVAASHPAIQAFAQPRWTHWHAGGLQFIHQLLAAPSLRCNASNRSRNGSNTSPAVFRFWAVRVPPIASAFSPAPVIQFRGNLCVINACAHNVWFAPFSGRKYVHPSRRAGHACPFIGRQPYDRLRSL